MPIERIPFAEAISEQLLFKDSWQELSLPQQVVLKAIYGLPLAGEELDIWSALNGGGVFDAYGDLKAINFPVPYDAVERSDVTLIIGRRGGKSEKLSSLLCAYEALCGGHKEYVGKRQLPYIMQVSQDLATSKACLRQFILQHLESSPIGRKELGNLKDNVTAETIRLKTAMIQVGPPTIKLRGQGIAVAAFDEVGVWASATDSANPDVEVARAVRPAQNQFPFKKLITTSTPWTEEGLLWQAELARREGRLAAKQLVLKAPTLLMRNPRVIVGEVKAEQAKDPESFKREYLAEFAKSVSGFLSPTLLRAATLIGTKILPPDPRFAGHYTATIDPAFRRDAFAFSIGCMVDGVYQLSYCEQWQGTKEAPISPLVALGAVARVCAAYGVRVVISDQYHLESLQEIAHSFGLTIEPCPLTNEIKGKMWGDFQGLLSLGKLKLLDNPILLDQLGKMDKILTPAGNIQFKGGGNHDDLAMVVALNVHRAFQLGSRANSPKEKQPVTLSEQFWAARKARGSGQTDKTPWWA